MCVDAAEPEHKAVKTMEPSIPSYRTAVQQHQQEEEGRGEGRDGGVFFTVCAKNN